MMNDKKQVKFAGRTYQPTGTTKKSCNDKMKAMDEKSEAMGDMASMPEQPTEMKSKKA